MKYQERPNAGVHRSLSRRPGQLAALYHSLFDRSGVGIAELDPRRRVRRANTTLLDLVGCGAVDVQDIEFINLLDLDSRTRLESGLNWLRTGQIGRFTAPVKVKRRGRTVPGDLTVLRLPPSAHSAESLIVLVQADPSAQPSADEEMTKQLSTLDAKILEGIAAGASTVQLATRFYLSNKGIEYHVGRMLRWLNVPNRSALVSRAYTMGILSSGTWPPRVLPRYVH